MKTLFLLRHAKSSWKDETLPDFERPLNRRGKRAAETIGQYFKTSTIFPELILMLSSRAHARNSGAGAQGFPLVH